MAGNREAYEQAMNAGHNAAWDQEWSMAIAAYGQAIKEFPEDPEAHNHLGLALLKVNRLEDSLKVYTRAHQLSPDDPIPLEKSADVLERMGRLKEAGQQYINVAEVYIGQRDLDKAIGNWERATRLTPGLVGIHAKLAQAYERVGDKRKAIREYLTLAFNFQRGKETDKAIKAVQRALRLEPKNSQVLNTLRALETGGEILPPAYDDADEPRSRLDEQDGFGISGSRVVIGEADPMGPLGEAMTDALGLLAMYVIESGELNAAGSAALQGLEFHRQGLQPQAIDAYQRAETQIRHPALKLNLGVLLVLNNQPAEAIKHLGEAVSHPQLQAGAYHALGRAYFDQNKQKQAARFLIQSIQAVDTSLAMDNNEIDELSSVYDQLFTTLEGATEEAMVAINNRFMKLLTGKDWKQRIAETRRQLEHTMRSEGGQAVKEILASEGGDRLTEAVSSIDRYTRQGLLTLAMDEAHRAVEFSPNYLPVHIRMAEIMMREGRVRQAIGKYNTVAKTYLVRGENERAASILGEVLEMAPLDVSVRKGLMELLEAEQRWDELLDQYVELADTYHQLGDFEMSRDTYITAEKLGTRVKASPEKTVKIKHRIADIDQMRLDMRKAMRAYEEIVQLAPDDERARRMLVDLNFRQGNQVEAVKRLDELLSMYAKKKQVNSIVKLLEEMVTLYPNDTGLRNRLATIFEQLGRKQDAIKHLDALGELQLEAGQHQDACNTLRRIIKMNPEGADDYKRLVAQLGC
jgi:tetratricopeptide (TPR) repeat protein